ncbi:hypothetical protein BAJUN_00980 [Bajunvirus bajun]|uniref:Uncharacterized protein n=1 Tax=Brevundimonas phage vB_BgoS-Bajun TaxID=2948594 RepID=A0A9E7N6M7_9CAUD|nr:hypothetical protein BAJUN_00980 [Brevundimonas phage vB_BgoS-Bajun]
MKLGPLKTAIRNFNGTVTANWNSSLFTVQSPVVVGFGKTMLIAALDTAYGKDNKVETGLQFDETTGMLARDTAEGNRSDLGM